MPKYLVHTYFQAYSIAIGLKIFRVFASAGWECYFSELSDQKCSEKELYSTFKNQGLINFWNSLSSCDDKGNCLSNISDRSMLFSEQTRRYVENALNKNEKWNVPLAHSISIIYIKMAGCYSFLQYTTTYLLDIQRGCREL